MKRWIRSLLLLGFVAALITFLLPDAALAAAKHPAVATAAVSVKALAVAAICGWVIPPLVDFVTKANLATSLKTVLATVLGGLAGAMATITWAPHERWQDYVFAIAVAVVNTQGAHRILVGLGDPVEKATGNVGIGPTPPGATRRRGRARGRPRRG